MSRRELNKPCRVTSTYRRSKFWVGNEVLTDLFSTSASREVDEALLRIRKDVGIIRYLAFSHRQKARDPLGIGD